MPERVVTLIAGKTHRLWRAVDDEGEVLDVLIQPRHGRKAAPKFTRRLPKRLEYRPNAIVTDRLRSYGAALRDLGLTDRPVIGGGRTTAWRFRISQPARENDIGADFDRQARRSGSTAMT